MHRIPQLVVLYHVILCRCSRTRQPAKSVGNIHTTATCPCFLQAFKGADYLFIVTDGGVVDPKAELQQGRNAADAAEQARPCTSAKASEYCRDRQEGTKQNRDAEVVP